MYWKVRGHSALQLTVRTRRAQRGGARTDRGSRRRRPGAGRGALRAGQHVTARIGRGGGVGDRGQLPDVMAACGRVGEQKGHARAMPWTALVGVSRRQTTEALRHRLECQIYTLGRASQSAAREQAGGSEAERAAVRPPATGHAPTGKRQGRPCREGFVHSWRPRIKSAPGCCLLAVFSPCLPEPSPRRPHCACPLYVAPAPRHPLLLVRLPSCCSSAFPVGR